MPKQVCLAAYMASFVFAGHLHAASGMMTCALTECAVWSNQVGTGLDAQQVLVMRC